MKEDPATFEQALSNPSGVFATPEAVVNTKDFTPEQRVRILRQWEYDARELEVAEEENMAGGPPDLLTRVLSAIEQLGVSPEHKRGSGKQG